LDAQEVNMNSEIKTAHANVTEFAYLACGSENDPAVIFLHGFPDDPHTWDGVVKLLTGEPLRLLRPWLRGFGGTIVSDERAKSGQVGALAQDVLDFADALGLEGFFLVGQDWGSRAVLGATVLAPQRVRGLVHLATAYGRGDVTAEQELRQMQAFWYQWLFQTAQGRELFAKDPINFGKYLWQVWSPQWIFAPEGYSVAAESFGNAQFIETVLHYYAHRWKSAPGSPAYTRQQEIIDQAPPISVPTIFACGTADACNLPEYSRGNERFFSGPYERIEIPGVGHFVQRERPEIVGELVRSLVRQL